MSAAAPISILKNSLQFVLKVVCWGRMIPENTIELVEVDLET